jgi:hypothetical protein
MIPTRIHAAVDWAAVVGVEIMGHSGLFSPRVQRLFKTSACLHAAYAGLTDYELRAGVLRCRGTWRLMLPLEDA